MRRLWRFIAWTASIAVVLVLLAPLLSTSVPNTPGDKTTQGSGSGKGKKGKHGDDGPVPVFVAKSRQADVPVYVEGVGTGLALNSVLIRSQVDGVLEKLNFTEGQMVKAGDVIAKIDPRLYQATLDQNIAKKTLDEATLSNAKLDLERYRKLIQTKAATQQQFDTQRATVVQNEAQVGIDQALIDSARTTLGYTNIVSPITGRTGIRKVDVGNLIHAADTTGLVTVSQIQPIAVIFNVPQQELPRINRAAIAKQLEVEATNSGGSSVVDTGVLAVIDNTIDQATGTVRLKAVFPNAKLQLWPGIFVNMRLKVETLHDAVVVPVASLQRGPKGPFVFTEADGKAKMRPVTVGQQDDTQAVLTAGLKAGETIITSGFSKLTDDAKVKPSQDEEAAAEAGKGAPALHQQGVSPPAQAPRPDAPPRGAGTPRRHRQSATE